LEHGWRYLPVFPLVIANERSAVPDGPPPGREPDPDKPDLSKPGALTESLRAMGLM
jgi:hypothetical protein